MEEVYDMAHELDRLRGSVISNFAFIESALDKLLAVEYASEEKTQRALFQHEVLEHRYFSFEFKKNLFQQIIKRKYPAEWGKFPKKDLEDMQTDRNIIAHAMLEIHNREGATQKVTMCLKYQGICHEAHELIQGYKAKSKRVQPFIEQYVAKITGVTYRRH